MDIFGFMDIFLQVGAGFVNKMLINCELYPRLPE